MPSENKTLNYGLNQWQGNEYPKRQDFVNDNLIIDTEIKKAISKADQAFQSASDGKQKIATAITGKGVPTGSSDTFQTMADNIESIETDPSIGTTDATAADILAPKKAVSQGQLITGTISVAPTFPNENEAEDTHFYGTDFASSNKGNNLFMKVPKGYYNGGWLGARINNLIPANVKAGVVIAPRLGGTKALTGAFTSDANAIASQILAGSIAYVQGLKVVGTMPNRGAINHSLPVNGSFTISEGYHNGSGKVTQNIPTKAAATITPGTTNQTIAANQYLSGNQVILGSPNLKPENIKDGVDIFGKVGTLKPLPVADLSDFNIYTNGFKADGKKMTITISPPDTKVEFLERDITVKVNYTLFVIYSISVWSYKLSAVGKIIIASYDSTPIALNNPTNFSSDQTDIIYNPQKLPISITPGWEYYICPLIK